MKYFIEDTTLTGIGDAIRAKGGTSDKILVSDLATAITNLPTGGGGDIEVEPIVLEGTQTYGCSGPLSGKYIDMFGDTISTQYLGDVSNMFYKNTATKIPFDLNCTNVTYYSFQGLFSNCDNLTELPNIYNAYPYNMSQMFSNCYNLREIPEDIDDTWNWDRMHTYNYASVNGCIQYCYSLRKIPESFMKNLWSTQTSNYSSIYYGLCNSCYALDEIRGIPIMPVTYTGNAFSNFMSMSARVKDIIFDMNEDGTPKTANWKGQSINLYNGIGYMRYTESYLYNYNSGITADKKVIDDATYQALKDDPDWFSSKLEYSRYNHDSAVNTINSLPDTSAYLAANGGTNTISFSSGMGRATDGGAISNLTEEEIAIATAKGWTVTLS